MRHRMLVVAALALAPVGPTHGQAPTPSDQSTEAAALRSCVTLVASGRKGDAQKPSKTAETLYRTRIGANARDIEAIVGLARTLSQCLLPNASFMAQGELSSEALDLLERALEIQPDHWLARYILASISYASPAFLGRGSRAAKELDFLLRQQGDDTDDPLYARIYELRGMLWSRAGQRDSALAVWTKGARLFPADSALRALSIAAKPSTPASAPPSAATSLTVVRVVASATPPANTSPFVRPINRSQILMTAGGGADVMQSVQMQPGATHVVEGSDVYTRGGDAAETSLLVNGGRLLSLSRFEGLNGGMFGAIEPFVVKSVRYWSGGFSARHGNALSGVLDIETDGAPRERQLRAGLSLVQMSATVRMPSSKQVSGWISGRASQTGPLLTTHDRRDEFDGAPHSEEVIASIIATPTAVSEIRATAIVERDDARRILNSAGWRGPFHSAGDTRALLVTSRWLPSRAPVAIRGSIAGSTRSSDWQFGVLKRDRDERSLVTRADADWQATTAVTLRAGIENGVFTRHDRGVLPTTPSVALGAPTRRIADAQSNANHVGTFAEADLVSGNSAITLGLRADRLPGESNVTLDPRVAISTRRGEWTARAGGGLFHQGRWRAPPAIPDAGTPSGTPTRATHLVLGLERSGDVTVRAEAFVKRYGDYEALGSGPRISRSRARGLDLLAQRSGEGLLSGWLGYSLLDSDARLLDGRRVRATFDITHSLTASATASVSADWSVGSTVRYGTGAPFTPIVGALSEAERVTPVYGSPASVRLPAYARVDARVMRFIRMSNYLLTTFVEIINLTDRPNASGVTYDAAYTTRMPVLSFFAQRTIVAGGEFQFR